MIIRPFEVGADDLTSFSPRAGEKAGMRGFSN
jgi:hypothetical protein